MKVELTKKEIEVILDLIDAGTTYYASHGQVKSFDLDKEDYLKPRRKGVVNVDILKTKLQEYLKPVEDTTWTAIKINKSTGEEIKIGDFISRGSAIDAISYARGIDLKDKKTYFEYLIESRF